MCLLKPDRCFTMLRVITTRMPALSNKAAATVVYTPIPLTGIIIPCTGQRQIDIADLFKSVAMGLECTFPFLIVPAPGLVIADQSQHYLVAQ